MYCVVCQNVFNSLLFPQQFTKFLAHLSFSCWLLSVQDLVELKGVKYSLASQSLGEIEVLTVTFEEELVFPDLEIENCFIHNR